MKRIELTLEGLTLAGDRALIILAGDLNQLDVDRVAECTGLVPMVKVPTREDNILDMLLVSEPCYQNIKIITSAIKSDHKAIIDTADYSVINKNKHATKTTLRKRSPEQHACFLPKPH